ncbi:hypothetical protein CASFOL_010215 [Castilleja foliolosa]|uniref:F-box domain-containing protein n=1 Tax=Castilleja foliolosa TaxID=1961234 RepID=A0ABD3DS35_9LAMI
MAAREGEFYFPEPIIQRIQSFLTGKEVARTAILSKSWHSAWLTRPNLDLDDTYFRRSVNRFDHVNIGGFIKYAKKTIKRYVQSNLKIESFKLRMDFNRYGRADQHAKKLIVNALRIGATRLNLRLDCESLVLPNEVFGADNLVELSVRRCRIKLDDGVVIKCRRLESLSINAYGITMDFVSNIVSSCPCIEKFSLLSELYQEYGFGQRVDAAMAVSVVNNLIPKLRCLVLGYESFKALCLGNLLSRLSFLKDFTLNLNLSSCSHVDAIWKEGIQISNRSLERIELGLKDYEGTRRPRIKFDVPSVCKFTFDGNVIPCLSFISIPPSREWESHVSIRCTSTIQFNELSELLTELSQSKTHLSLYTGGKLSFAYNVGEKIIQGYRKHELESLRVHAR